MTVRSVMTRSLVALFAITLLGGCSARAWYSGLQKAEQQRQATTPGAPERTTPDMPYDRYETERKGTSTGDPQ